MILIAFRFTSPIKDKVHITLFDLQGKIVKNVIHPGGKKKREYVLTLPNKKNATKILLYRLQWGNHFTSGSIFACQ